MSDSSLGCYRAEYDALKSHTPNVPVTTNLMGTFKPLDYFAWAPYLDVVSWDSYPRWHKPGPDGAIDDIGLASEVAFVHDISNRKRMEQVDDEGHDLEYNFKAPDHPLQLVFVCAMWLTGFDAPTVSTVAPIARVLREVPRRRGGARWP